jgi:hypothetical protein
VRDELIIHGGVVFESVINYLDKFGPEILVIQFGFLVILSTIFLWLWFSNRRKYHNLKHAIPANIVKSYLDSIIQNSTSLKSQLFRGGGLDLGNVPSVMPLHNLIGGEGLAVSGAPSTALMEELNQRKAQVASLDAQLNSSTAAQREMESKLGQSQGNLSTAAAKIKELESLLAQKGAGGGNNAAASGGSNDAALKAELSNVTKERDDLRDRLREFEIIADDLANLKRLQQENDQLKKSLAAQGGGKPADAPVPQEASKNIISQADVSDLFEDLGKGEESAAAADNSALEDFLSSPTDTESAVDSAFEEAQAAMAAEESDAAPEGDKPKSEKTPEDLLSEFEKMLG